MPAAWWQAAEPRAPHSCVIRRRRAAWPSLKPQRGASTDRVRTGEPARPLAAVETLWLIADAAADLAARLRLPRAHAAPRRRFQRPVRISRRRRRWYSRL